MGYLIDQYLDPVDPVEAVREYIYEDIDLGGDSWNYRIYWNDRAERWVMDVYSSDGNKAVYGKRMVPNYPLFWANTGRRPEGGFIMLYDTGDPKGSEPCSYEGLGNRWKICWLVDDGSEVSSDRPWVITIP